MKFLEWQFSIPVYSISVGKLLLYFHSELYFGQTHNLITVYWLCLVELVASADLVL